MTWSILGESVPGTSHRARQTVCQDAFRYGTFGSSGEWLVIAVADGAGSAARPERGATLVCDEFVRRVASREGEGVYTQESIRDLFADVRREVVAEAERLQVRPRELACTALLAVIGPASATFAQLGDGAIVIRQGEEFRPVFWPEPAEYANATDFLTEDGFADCIQFRAMTETIMEAALMTDGLQRLALDFSSRGAYPDFFRPLFNTLRNVVDAEALVLPFRTFLDSDRVNQRTDDDKTLVFALRRS